MALKCQGKEDCWSSNDSVSDSLDEQVSGYPLESEIDFTHLGGNTWEETHSVYPIDEGVALVDGGKIGSSSDLSCSAVRRSITDLPSALVVEILHRLEARELGIVSCVSTALHKLASDHYGWKEFYCERWGLPLDLALPDERSWKEIFVEREYRSKAFMGRYSVDCLYGHTEAVRSVFLLAPAKLVFTGGYDYVVRIWDMEEGLLFVSSRPLGCTIRAVAADPELLVAGGTDGFLHCWRSNKDLRHLFDIKGSLRQCSEFRLWEHQGPVTCVALDASKIYSGSWDMSIRVWDRIQLKCVMVLKHEDWVWSLVPCGSSIASSAGRDVYVWDVESGTTISVVRDAHVGNAYSLARSCLGDLLFTGGEDGTIHMYEVSKDSSDDNIDLVATWAPHTSHVLALAFEFPWLVSSSGDGKIVLIDVRKVLRSRQCSSSRSRRKMATCASVEAPQRMLHGFGPNLFSVGIGADRIVCGGEEGVRIWNFSQALEIEKRVRALRGIRLENRMRRRKVQVEMNSQVGRADQCSVAAIRNQNRDKSGIWHKRGVSGKLKA